MEQQGTSCQHQYRKRRCREEVGGHPGRGGGGGGGGGAAAREAATGDIPAIFWPLVLKGVAGKRPQQLQVRVRGREGAVGMEVQADGVDAVPDARHGARAVVKPVAKVRSASPADQLPVLWVVQHGMLVDGVIVSRPATPAIVLVLAAVEVQPTARAFVHPGLPELVILPKERGLRPLDVVKAGCAEQLHVLSVWATPLRAVLLFLAVGSHFARGDARMRRHRCQRDCCDDPQHHGWPAATV
mmetsp:Transcript_15442/g.43204  ORF Transcript_15442/g.43204 Transcript_15442/m.43204 type:complete len:242 (+) Transcript_15442:281-1006(+)